MSEVEKRLVTLEDLALGSGVVVQDRNGVSYMLYKIDLVPSVDTVEELDTITSYTKAKVGLVNYKKEDDAWAVDPIPVEAFGGSFGTAASRDATGAGNLIALGYAGIGGAALSSLTGAGFGLKASYVTTILEGGPANEPTVVLTLPGPTADAARLAITLTNVALHVQKVGSSWIKLPLAGTDVTFASIVANSVRADAIGTPKA